MENTDRYILHSAYRPYEEVFNIACRGDVIDSICAEAKDIVEELFALAEDIEANHHQMARLLFRIVLLVIPGRYWQQLKEEYPEAWPDDVPTTFTNSFDDTSVFQDTHDFNSCAYAFDKGSDLGRWEAFYKPWIEAYALFVIESRFRTLPRSYPCIVATKEEPWYCVLERLFVESETGAALGYGGYDGMYCYINEKNTEEEAPSAEERYARYVAETGKEDMEILERLRFADALWQAREQIRSLGDVDIWAGAAPEKPYRHWDGDKLYDQMAACGMVGKDGSWHACGHGMHEKCADRIVENMMLIDGEKPVGDALTYLIEERGWCVLHKPSPAMPWKLEHPSAWDTGRAKPSKKQKDALWDVIEQYRLDTSEIDGIETMF